MVLKVQSCVLWASAWVLAYQQIWLRGSHWYSGRQPVSFAWQALPCLLA
jgi:hypothetical protein